MTKWHIDNLKGATFCQTMNMSVNEWGIMEPIAITADGTVVDGRKRLAAARFLNYSMVPVKIYKLVAQINTVDSRIIQPEDVKLYDFVKMGTCGTRLYLKVEEHEYLELQEMEDPILFNQAVVDWQEFRKPMSTVLAFEDKIVKQSTRSYGGIYTTVVNQYTKPAAFFKRYSIVRLHGGLHPYLIYAKSAEEIFLRSLVSGAKKSYPIATPKLFTKQIIVEARIT